MAKTDGCRSAQSGRNKPYNPAGNTIEDLAVRWGVKGKEGPPETQRETPAQSIPGGLEAAPDEQEPQSSKSLDQPNRGTDRLDKTRLDQANEANDRRARLDQSSQEDGDRLRVSLDQAHGASDRQASELEPNARKETSEKLDDESKEPEGEGSRGNQGRGTDNDEGVAHPGSPSVPNAWRKVTRMGRSRDERSDGSNDVENLLDNSETEDNSRYFQKWFGETQENGDSEPEDEAPEEAEWTSRSSSKRSKRRSKKKSKKSNRKDKEPVRPRGYDAFMSSISQIGRGGAQNPATENLSAAIAKPDKRDIPSGVHFNKVKGTGKRASQHSKE